MTISTIRHRLIAKSIIGNSLSSLSDDEDNCHEDTSQNEFRVVITMVPYIHFFEMQPWREAFEIDDIDKVVTFHENSSQTDSWEVVMRDATIQLEPIDVQDAEIQVEMRMSAIRKPKYAEDAFERILRYLSKKKYKKELMQWRQPNISLQFFITPISEYAAKILHAEYNEAMQVFLLLVEDEQEITLEKWTLENLLYTHPIKLDMKLDEETASSLSTYNNLVTVSCARQLILAEVDRNETIFSLKSKENIICVRVYDMQVTWITIDGCIWQRRVYGAFSRRIGWIPIGLGDRFYYGCFSDAHIHILTQSSAIHCRLHDPSDYDFVETDTEFISIDRLIPLDESRYIIFRTKSLKAELWSYDEPRRNTHELQFSNTERVVDFHWHNSYLYSLTNNGEISKWRFLPKRRKQRVWIFTSHVNNCVRLISVAEHKFIIQAATRLVFDVVASSNSKT